MNSNSHRWFPRVILVLALFVLGAFGIWMFRSREAAGPTAPGPQDPIGFAPPNRPATPTVSPSSATGNTQPTPETRAAEILSELETGHDSGTGQDFKIGADGRLTGAPTRRVALLDELTRLDPKVAAGYAATILDGGFTSPDEWAVCLRNYANGNTTAEARAFLEEKLKAMLQHAPWQTNPSTGFLEAFDVAVYLGGTNLVPTLAGFLRPADNRALSHAAYLALDRLTLAEPASTLALLQQQPELMQGREQTRANYFARANVGDPTQRSLVESYLLNPSLAPAELDAFAGLFPNANYMISHNLLTRVATPNGATLARQDRESLRVVESWLSDSRFAGRAPALEKMRSRLQSFTSSAGREP